MNPTRRAPRAALLAAFAAALAPAVCAATEPLDPLKAGFADPPASARPLVWWHWLNGNVTRDGIAKDLAWMKRVGLGGVQNFDATLFTPPVVEKRLAYMTPEWRDALRFAVETASANGLEFAIASSAGWSETGGPWVAPKDGLKKLVWSETPIRGGKRFTGTLAAPMNVTGPFQSLPAHDPLAGPGPAAPGSVPSFYADVAVIAFPAAAAPPAPPVQVSAGTGQPLDAVALADDSLETGVDIDKGSAAELPAVVIRYAQPRRVAAATLFIPGALPPFGDPSYLPVLEAREGSTWRKVAEFPLSEVPTTASFAAVTAREFRVVLAPNTAPKRIGLGAGAPGAAMADIFPSGPPSRTVRIAELRLSGVPFVHRFEAKAGFSVAPDYYALGGGADAGSRGVRAASVVDLSSKLRPDGTLDWTPPPGRWTVLRLGYSLTGKTNHPASAEATGLEVDKYDAAAVRRYLETYLDRYTEAVGRERIGAKGITALLNDSIEVGSSNWTPALLARFQSLRGYDPRPWLPTLTGTLVGSRAESDAFLYDFRRTLAELIASDHYGTLASVAHERGLKLYGEALEDGRPVLGDDMAMRSHADVPMAALWSYPRGGAPRPTLLGDMKGASSVAHVYGRSAVAAESFTSAFAPWAHGPADLRPFVDLEFAYGITRPVIHTSVHQPVDDRQPGLSLAIFGQYFNRHDTWAEMARPWIDYIARSSYLLQQGHNVADVAYFYGEEMPLTALFAQAPLADTPVEHAYDFVNRDVVLNDLRVESGRLVTRAGASYRALYLGGTSRRMTLAVIKRLAELRDAGATIVGEPPSGSPALTDDPAAFTAVVRRLWPRGGDPRGGAGRVLASRDVDAALATVGVRADVRVSVTDGSPKVLFVHRQTDDADIYFLDNRRDGVQAMQARFRITGRLPEFWHADTGTSERVSYRVDGGDTVVPLTLGAGESLFVVFRVPTTVGSASIATPAPVEVRTLAGPWQVGFQAGRGAPASATFDTLMSLSESADAGIRYFSGIASYRTQFLIAKGAGPQLALDLGEVGDVAEVLVNGRSAGIAWKSPYRVDVAGLLRTGTNDVEVRVANLWVNRLIGDAQPGAHAVAFTSMPTYRPDAPLRRAGLMGPVRLIDLEIR